MLQRYVEMKDFVDMQYSGSFDEFLVSIFGNLSVSSPHTHMLPLSLTLPSFLDIFIPHFVTPSLDIVLESFLLSSLLGFHMQ